MEVISEISRVQQRGERDLSVLNAEDDFVFCLSGDEDAAIVAEEWEEEQPLRVLFHQLALGKESPDDASEHELPIAERIATRGMRSEQERTSDEENGAGPRKVQTSRSGAAGGETVATASNNGHSSPSRRKNMFFFFFQERASTTSSSAGDLASMNQEINGRHERETGEARQAEQSAIRLTAPSKSTMNNSSTTRGQKLQANATAHTKKNSAALMSDLQVSQNKMNNVLLGPCAASGRGNKMNNQQLARTHAASNRRLSYRSFLFPTMRTPQTTTQPDQNGSTRLLLHNHPSSANRSGSSRSPDDADTQLLRCKRAFATKMGMDDADEAAQDELDAFIHNYLYTSVSPFADGMVVIESEEDEINSVIPIVPVEVSDRSGYQHVEDGSAGGTGILNALQTTEDQLFAQALQNLQSSQSSQYYSRTTFHNKAAVVATGQSGRNSAGNKLSAGSAGTPPRSPNKIDKYNFAPPAAHFFNDTGDLAILEMRSPSSSSRAERGVGGSSSSSSSLFGWLFP
ncbi:unnamed protein product [Amoebophrya sp. A120]|nr:unnamed protein product [Amoebophrya sp. A120]|eukprot:GSA120T00011672001.1